jgi:hypothetical protein
MIYDSPLEKGEYYLGMPVPTLFEEDVLKLKLEQGFEADDQLTIPFIFEAVLHRNPRIQEIINHDIRQLIQYEIAELSDAEQSEYISGVLDGYSFMLGTITYIHYLRSGSHDFTEYLDGIPEKDNELPLLDPGQIRRIKQVRTGQAIVDCSREVIDDSKDLAFFDTGDYMFEALRMEEIYGAEEQAMIEQLQNMKGRKPLDENSLLAHINGFHHGTEQAIEMYIQAREEDLIRNLESRLG